METLEVLENYSTEQFEKWLYGQLRMIYHGTPEQKYRACDFRSFSISRGESHIEDLQNLFKKLNDNTKEKFKTSLDRILRHAKPGDFPEEAMTDVIVLIGLTDAYNVFSSFSSVLGSGSWGEVKPSLFYDALSILMMFERSEEAYDAVKDLATSTNFPKVLVFDAYIIMIRCHPECWRDDYVLLREQFRKVIFDIESSPDSERIKQLNRKQSTLAQSISKSVPMYRIGNALYTLDFKPSTTPQKCSDVWLIDNLLGPSGSLIATSNEISDRSKPERKAKLITDSGFEILGLSRGWINFQSDQNNNENNFSAESSKRLQNVMRITNVHEDCTRELANA